MTAFFLFIALTMFAEYFNWDLPTKHMIYLGLLALFFGTIDTYSKMSNFR